MRESNSIRSYCIIMKPSHSTEYADTVRGCVFIRKNERAYRGSERREQFHEFGALVIRACTKTVDGHGAIMEFNNAICVLSLSLSLFLSFSNISVLSPLSFYPHRLSVSPPRKRCGAAPSSKCTSMSGQEHSVARFAG